MIVAAIYARKSTDQSGVNEDDKSVTRQVDHARDYAQRKGWTVAAEHIYVDDGRSGAEFKNRPDFMRLMNALKPKPPFTVLIMSEESRLGRESIETAYTLNSSDEVGAWRPPGRLSRQRIARPRSFSWITGVAPVHGRGRFPDAAEGVIGAPVRAGHSKMVSEARSRIYPTCRGWAYSIGGGRGDDKGSPFRIAKRRSAVGVSKAASGPGARPGGCYADAYTSAECY